MFRRYQSGDIFWILFRFLPLSCAVSSQLRNDSVFTHFHSCSRTATGSATNEYGTVPERPIRNEEQNSKTSGKPSTGPKWSKLMMKYIFFEHETWIFLLFDVIGQTIFFSYFPIFEKCLIFCFYYHLLCRRWNKHFGTLKFLLMD